MARFSYPLFFFISHLSLLSLAEDERSFNPRCPNFQCGNLGYIGFPFSNWTHPECGLMMVDDCNEPVQKIQLGKGPLYNITDISDNNTITLEDQVFQNYLNNNSCESLKNLTLPSPPLLSFEIKSKLTLFKCPSKFDPKDTNFCFFCKDSIIFYNLAYTRGNGKRNLVIVLGIGAGVVVLIAVLSICFIRIRKKQKHASQNLQSANTSSLTSSNSDLETGTVYFGVPIFSYSDLADATNNFNHEKELGDGGFGTVYHGKLRDGREVAVKRLYEHNYRRVEQFMNEIEILTRLRHTNLVSLYGCTSRHSQGLLLVYEFVPNGTVGDHLHGGRAKSGLLSWTVRMNIAIETASALAYLHASDIIHRDVKTNNILLDNNFGVKVADFGLSRLFPTDVSHISTAPQGTPGYVDPEYHQCYQLTDKSDVYSFGVVLIELISSMPAVDITRHRHEINLANLAMNKIQKCEFDELIDPCLGYDLDEEVKRMTTSVAELAFLCLQQNKEMRPSMDVVLEELERIQNGEPKYDNQKEKQDDVENLKSKQPQSPPHCDEFYLLKNIRLSSSPISVTEKWLSHNSTPNVSS